MASACSVYGLGVQVNVPISALTRLPAQERVDVRMTLGSMPASLDQFSAENWSEYGARAVSDAAVESGHWYWRHASGEFFRVNYPDDTVIVIDSEGQCVWATWPPTATVEDTATYLLGPTLGFVLSLRGIACLHASAIVIDGKAVAIVGASGAGKSTLAAAFARRGSAVLTDDVLALEDQGRNFNAQPAYPRVRLWPASVDALFGSTDALPLLTPNWDKRFLDLAGPRHHFQHERLPLAAIYFLQERSACPSAPNVSAIGIRDGLMALVANSYAGKLLDKTMRAKEFELFDRLVRNIPMRRVTPHADICKIPQLCEVLEEDFMGLGSSSGS